MPLWTPHPFSHVRILGNTFSWTPHPIFTCQNIGKYFFLDTPPTHFQFFTCQKNGKLVRNLGRSLQKTPHHPTTSHFCDISYNMFGFVWISQFSDVRNLGRSLQKTPHHPTTSHFSDISYSMFGFVWVSQFSDVRKMGRVNRKHPTLPIFLTSENWEMTLQTPHPHLVACPIFLTCAPRYNHN